LGFTVDGGFADYLAISIEGPLTGTLNLLPGDLSFSNAVLAEPLACCINAQDKITIQPEDTVLIMSAGPLGLLHAGLAGLLGAEVLIAEVDAHRRQTAEKLGADKVFDPSEESCFQTVADATRPKGVDVIILATSEVGLDEKFIKLLAPGGRISIFSGTPPRLSKIQLDSNLIHYNELVLTGAYGCTAHQNHRALDLIASKKIPVNKLITQQVTLDKIVQGLEYTKSKRSLKSIVEVQDEY
jgi:L-iditol 2-dehydrogenase